MEKLREQERDAIIVRSLQHSRTHYCVVAFQWPTAAAAAAGQWSVVTLCSVAIYQINNGHTFAFSVCCCYVSAAVGGGRSLSLTSFLHLRTPLWSVCRGSTLSNCFVANVEHVGRPMNECDVMCSVAFDDDDERVMMNLR